MRERVVAAIDQGTTSTRCLLFNRSGRMLAVAQREHRQHYPAPGLVEHDAAEIWRNVGRVVPAALRSAGLGPEDLVALGIANQRETTVVWDRRTGVPISRAITWQDTRTDGIVARLADDGHAPLITAVCGLAPATYFAGPRLRWILDHVPGAREGAEAGDLLFGTMESWLIWNLTGGPDGGRHVTDVTNASRTMLMDLRTLEWSDALLDVLDVPRRMLPEVRSNAEVYGTCTSVLPGVPVAGALGDQQAALVGQACFAPGEAKCTYGTGAFLLMNTGGRIAESTHGLIPTVGYLLEPMATGGEPVYALEGAIAMTGSLVQWFRDSLGMIGTAAQIETLAETVEDNGGCYIVPAFSGLYSPRWHPDARGVMVGLTSFINRGHLARAVLEATGWQTREVVDAMNLDSGVPVTRLKVDGGMTANHLLMQFVADVLDVPVERPLGSEAVSLGAAYAAGLAVGHWAGVEVLRSNWHRAAAWEPAMDPGLRRREHENWGRAVNRSYGWVQTPAG
ncbi:glycerol kinase GlpK [Pseudonocardia broussonetiae]|uniref:glycerol kinase n=1 Tax=Pseudonocardia broussonetiae TaxID=2736640 RepID=A0A6M6JC65_9PSEU|nr:glycerol kinase GlpK [Pseudonocardia broussonetiae]QJY44537.1 glycerol kinase GlpK [Pseudonocardia broussonetiae]